VALRNRVDRAGLGYPSGAAGAGAPERRSDVRAAVCPASREELFEASIEDPHALFARLRRETPLSRIEETGVHLVASWDLVAEVLEREADFSANLTGVLIRGADGRPTAFELPVTAANQVIATADEPDHAVHRGLVQRAFSPARLAALEGPVVGYAEEALDAWTAAGGGDFVPVAEEVPARTVARLLGLPDGDVRRHRAWAMMGGDMLAGDLVAARLVALATETGRMVEYLGAALDAATPAPSADEAPLLDVLAGGVARGEIGRDPAIGIAIVMFGAGGESTAALIGSAVRLLAENTDLAERLRAEPDLVPRYVEEVMRLEAPFKFHYRVVRRACSLGGADLAPGDRLMLCWASANRDAAHFEDPDTLRLDRRHPKLHMGVGRGGHFCLGAGLARLEARVVLCGLLARTKRVALRPGAAPVHARSIFVRRLEQLPLVIDAA
jgi:cytochrome P450